MHKVHVSPDRNEGNPLKGKIRTGHPTRKPLAQIDQNRQKPVGKSLVFDQSPQRTATTRTNHHLVPTRLSFDEPVSGKVPGKPLVQAQKAKPKQEELPVGSFSFDFRTNKATIDGQEVAPETLLPPVTSSVSNAGAELAPTDTKPLTKAEQATVAPAAVKPVLTDEDWQVIAQLTGLSIETVRLAQFTMEEALAMHKAPEHTRAIADQTVSQLLTTLDVVSSTAHDSKKAQEAMKAAETASALATSKLKQVEREQEKGKKLLDEQMTVITRKINDAVDTMENLALKVKHDSQEARQGAEELLERLERSVRVVKELSKRNEDLASAARTSHANFQKNGTLLAGIVEGMRDQTTRTFDQMSEMYSGFLKTREGYAESTRELAKQLIESQTAFREARQQLEVAQASLSHAKATQSYTAQCDRFMLQHGFSLARQDINSIADNEFTALTMAVREQQLDIVRELVERRYADPNGQTAYGNTALHIAMYDVPQTSPVFQKMIDYLISKGASVKVQNKEGITVQQLALAAGITLGDADSADVVLLAVPTISTPSAELSEFIGKHGFDLQPANINLPTANGYTALTMAVKEARLDIIRELVEVFNACINAPTIYDNTPMHIAMYDIPADSPVLQAIVQYLVKTGAALDIHNTDGLNPSQLAGGGGVMLFSNKHKLQDTYLKPSEDLCATENTSLGLYI